MDWSDPTVDVCGIFIIIDLLEYKLSNEEIISDEIKIRELMKVLNKFNS